MNRVAESRAAVYSLHAESGHETTRLAAAQPARRRGFGAERWSIACCVILLLLHPACRHRTPAPDPTGTGAAAGHPAVQPEIPPAPASAGRGPSSESEAPGSNGPQARAHQHPALRDRGVLKSWAEHVVVPLPDWLRAGPVYRWEAAEEQAWLVAAGVPVSTASAATGIEAPKLPGSPGFADTDRDGVPDAFDVQLGAHKHVLQALAVSSGETPGGPPEPSGPPAAGSGCRGLLFDALANAGFTPPSGATSGASAPASGSHLVRWFERHWTRLPAAGPTSPEPVLPGDVVVVKPPSEVGAARLGLVLALPGKPHESPTVVWHTPDCRLQWGPLADHTLQHRYRVARAALPVAAAARGLSGVLRRNAITLPARTRQVVLVAAALATQSAAWLRRFERDEATGDWRAVGSKVAARLGRSGLGAGRGLPMNGSLSLPDKREGDGRAPAGVFELGSAFGPGRRAPAGASWPWRRVRPGDVFVDDPRSDQYNQWQQLPASGRWRSAEDLTVYRLGIVVEHNRAPVVPFGGSAIFIHTSDLQRPTAGCTAIREHQLLDLLAWLDPDAHPLLVQLVEHYAEE